MKTSFDEESRIEWSGSVENSFFRPELFDKHRKLKQPEYEYWKTNC